MRQSERDVSKLVDVLKQIGGCVKITKLVDVSKSTNFPLRLRLDRVSLRLEMDNISYGKICHRQAMKCLIKVQR
jgi:hypothetical protein